MIQDLVLFLAGLVVGGMNAIAGGGMLIGFPVLLATGMTPLAANITSNLILIPGSLSSAFGYRKYIKKLSYHYLLLLIPCLLGGLIGALILRKTNSERFQEIVPSLVLFAVILFAFQPLIHLHLHRHINKKIKRIKPLAWIALAIFPVAIYGGYFGAGFGFIMLAFLGFTKLHDIHKMNGLKNLASMSIASVSLISLYSTHLIDWRRGLLMAAGGIIGGYSGSLYSQKISTHTVRIIVIIIGLGTAAYLGLRTY